MTKQEQTARLLANLKKPPPDCEYYQRTLRMPSDLWLRTQVAAARCDLSVTQFVMALLDLQWPALKDDDEMPAISPEALKEAARAQRIVRRDTEEEEED